jgi:hypothetical protein
MGLSIISDSKYLDLWSVSQIQVNVDLINMLDLKNLSLVISQV